jgi:hypothetical protein
VGKGKASAAYLGHSFAHILKVGKGNRQWSMGNRQKTRTESQKTKNKEQEPKGNGNMQ